MRPARTITLVALSTALAFALVGCGGGNSASTTTTSTTDWANGFCTAYTTWKDSIKSIGDQLTSSLSKEGLDTAATDTKTATQKFSDDLKALGKPDTQSGQEVKSSVDQLATTLQDDLTKIEDTANGVSGLSGIPSAATTISGTITAMGAAVTSTLQTIQNANVKGDLKTAFDQAPACKGVTSSGGS